MATVAALVEQTRQRLRPGRRDTLNKLNGALTALSTSLVFSYDSGIASNVRYSVDLEDILGWDANKATMTATPLQRGFNGSTAAIHADGSIVYVNAEISAFEIFRAFNEVLAALPGEGIYKFSTVSLTANASRTGYDMTSVGNLLAVHKVRYKAVGGRLDYIPVPRNQWSVGQSMPTADFASAEALFVYGGMDPGQSVQVLYKAPFTDLTALADDVEAISGLPSSMHALLVVGAALRLTQGRPIERAASDAQGDTRRPQEVTTNDTRLSMTPLELEWQRGVKRARKELIRRHG